MKSHLDATWLWLHSKRHRIYFNTTRIWMKSYLNTTAHAARRPPGFVGRKRAVERGVR